MDLEPNNRAQYLLKVLIQKYISDGSPIGSRTLLEDSGLDISPATVRHVMSDLEDHGLIRAPHTSSGRIPTARGYRMFVDTLVRYQKPDTDYIDEIQSDLRTDNYDTGQLIDKVSNTLSRITSLAGIVKVPKGDNVLLKRIEFLPLSENRILTILVLNNDEVQNRILDTKEKHSSSELQKVSNFINENYANQSLDSIRMKLVSDMDETRLSMNKEMQDIISTASKAMEVADENEDEFDKMAVKMTVKGYANKVKCPTLLVTGEFDPLCPLEDAIEVYDDLTARKEMWVVEDQFHPLWGIPNLGKLDCHHYIIDWLSRALLKDQTNDGRIAYVGTKGQGPFSDCEWKPPVGPGEAYF